MRIPRTGLNAGWGNSAGVVRDSRLGNHRNAFEYLSALNPTSTNVLYDSARWPRLFDQRTRQR